MPKGTRRIQFTFDERSVTHFGGMWLVQHFCSKLRLKKRLQEYVRSPQRRSEYRSSEVILALVFAIIMGLRRINKTEILQYNGSFLDMLGLRRFPDQATLRRFLKRLSPRTIRQIARLHDSLRAYLFAFPKPRTSLIFDLDSLHRIDRVRPQRGSSHRIQPQEAGAPLVPSAVVLRGDLPGILARQSSAGQRRSLDRSGPVFEAVFGKGSSGSPPLADPAAHGFRVLRKPRNSVSGGLSLRFRDGGQGVQEHPRSGSGMPVPPSRQRLGGGRVPRESPSQDGPPPSVRGGAASHSGGSPGGGTTDALQGSQASTSTTCLSPI